MRQIITLRNQFDSVRMSVCLYSHARIWWIFTKIGTDVKKSKSKNEFVGVNIAPPLPSFCS